MKTMQQLLDDDRSAMRDSNLTEEQYRDLLAGAVEVFREDSIRGAFPTRVVNDPGVLESRHALVVDAMEAQHGMSGTGGSWDQADFEFGDVPAYAIWHNGLVRWRERLAAARSGNMDLLRETGRVMGEKVREKENAMLITGVGIVTGFESMSDVQTRSGSSWGTAGNAWDDIVDAVEEDLRSENVPAGQAALLVHPQEKAKLMRTFSSTAQTQKDQIEAILPGGVHTNTNVTSGTAWVYARIPSVVEYVVYQDLTMVPLGKGGEEDERVRARVIGAWHHKRPEGVVKITGVA